MSLFGGDGASSRPTPPPQFEDSASERSLSPQNAQTPPAILLDSDDLQGSLEDGSESELLSASDLEPSDPSHSALKPPTWRRYTALEREITASLDAIESADLSAALYNSHHLKKRVLLPAERLREIKAWQNKESWQRKGEELQYEDPRGDLQTELVPSKLWTAWPLPPNAIPVRSTTISTAEGDAPSWYIGSSTPTRAGEVMREEMLALLLRSTKEVRAGRHDAERQAAERQADWDRLDEAYAERDADTEMADERLTKHSESSESEEEAEKASGNTQSSGDDDSDGQMATDEESTVADSEGEESDREPAEELQPASLADDDEARRILGPSISSMLSNLDSLALAVRRSRLNHFRHRAQSPASDSEYLTETETAPNSRVPSRPQSRASSQIRDGQHSSPRKIIRSMKYKKKIQLPTRDEPLDSDSGSEYASSKSSNGTPSPPRRSRNASPGSAASSSTWTKSGVGLMDWSEILGLASVTGWSESAVSRTAQRCALLFGEGMSFRTFDASKAAQPVAEPVQYNPTTIAAFAEEPLRPYFKPGSTQSCPHEECGGRAWREPSDVIKHIRQVHHYDPRTNNEDNAIMEQTSRGTAKKVLVKKRPYFQAKSLRCPHSNCKDSKVDAETTSRLIQHIKRVHGYDPRTNDSDNEERTDGGVHIDGFLQPVTAKPGWVGAGRAKSDGQKVANFVKPPSKKKLKTESLPPVRLGENQACSNCKRNKRACDGGRPCDKCTFAKEESTCRDQQNNARQGKPKDCLSCIQKGVPCNQRRPCLQCGLGNCVTPRTEFRVQMPCETCSGCLIAKQHCTDPKPCTACKKRKRKCDMGRPCGACTKSGAGDDCTYEE